MFHKIKNLIGINILNIKSKLWTTQLLNKIFSKSNISKIIIIFVVGFVSRVLVCHFYGINVYTEYFNNVSCIYYMLMATFVVILGEVVTYFEINIIPSSLINSYTFVIRGFTYALELLVDIGKTVSSVNKNMYSLIFTKGVGYILRDIKISSWILSIKGIFNNNIGKMTLGAQVTNNDLNNSVISKFLNTSKEVKISNVFNKDSDNGEKLSSKVYNPNINTGELNGSNDTGNTDVNEVISSNNPNRSGVTITASEIGFHSGTIRRGDDILLVSPNRNVESSIDHYPYSMERDEIVRGGDFNLYDSEGSGFQTPATMSPLFNTYSVNPNAGYTGLVQTSTGMRPVSTTSSYHVRANDYPAPLTIRNRVASPSALWNPKIKPGFHNILPTDSEPNLSRRSLARVPNSSQRYTESVYSSPYIDTNAGVNVITPRDPESDYYHRVGCWMKSSHSSDNPCSPNYRSKHHRSVNYVDAREAVLTKMKERYVQADLAINNNEVVILNDKKLGKVKLCFEDFGDTFNNGVRKIKSLYIKYEGIGKRKIYWNIFEVGTGNYESYTEFKKSWDSNKGLWKHIKDSIKTDIKRDVEELLGMRSKGGVIGNRPIDNLIEQKRAYERLKDRNAKLKANIDVADVSKVAKVQEDESVDTQNKNESKHRRHSHSHSHSHRHRHGHDHVHKHRQGHTHSNKKEL